MVRQQNYSLLSTQSVNTINFHSNRGIYFSLFCLISGQYLFIWRHFLFQHCYAQFFVMHNLLHIPRSANLFIYHFTIFYRIILTFSLLFYLTRQRQATFLVRQIYFTQ